ncbi:pre-60S factor rei1 [Coemansia interrupta]|uniref:Pre-60S factor rei1 n=1 Tax=Coemansia interrupta TaxID=1126814 RepID=A0A9W8LMI3_9FUNG|nr:pre-60S factor rei1 [Coemansia interrupta]
MDGSTSTLPTNANNTPLFTCMACQVAFYSADQQRSHYRTDWHRYNLKRKVAELPAVTAESFAQRVLAQQAKTLEAEKKKGFSAECTVCKKSYGSENGFKNHLESRKHKEAEARMVERMQEEEDMRAEQEEEEDMRAEQEAIAESLASAYISGNAGAQQGAEAAAVDTVAVESKGEAKTPGPAGERNPKVSDFPISDDEESSEDDDEEDNDDEEDEKNETKAEEAEGEPQPTSESVLRSQERTIKQELQQATSEAEVVKILEKKKATTQRLDIETDCLFCTHKSDSFDSNMSHMSHAHSLFIPDLEYLVDLRGLIKYLADKLSVANVCLYCNGRGRALQSLDAVRKHMLDKGHCKIAYETEIDVLEISDFYDFSSTYPDAHEHDADEEVEGVALVKGNGRYSGPDALEEEDGELVLPSGARIGHRSLQRYYKQSIPLERTEKDSVVIHKMLTNYSENPGQFSNQLIQSRQNRAMVLAMPGGRQAIKDFTTYKEKRARQDFSNRIGMRMNGLQKHYREQNPI